MLRTQLQFWKRAEDVNEIQAEWFKELLTHKNYFFMLLKQDSKITGFVVGKLVFSSRNF
jgi:hypothetical protein